MDADTTPAPHDDTQPENMADWTTISPTASEEEIAAMVIGRAS